MCLIEDKHTEGGKIKIKMQADQKPVIWTVVIATLALLVAGLIGGSVINSNLKLTADALDDISVDVDEQAIVNAIMAGIVMPEIVIPESDTSRLCELTPGCEFYEYDFGFDEVNWAKLSALVTEDLDDAEEDFNDALLEIIEDRVGVDKDDFEVTVIYDLKDYQVRAYTEDDFDDDNWEVQVYMRVKYTVTDEDIDEDDEDGHIYLLVTSVLDEGEYDSMAVEEVSRRFEFE